MRVIFKTFFILSLLSVLYALSPYSIYAAACSGPGYTCRLNDCAVDEKEDTSHTCSVYDYICCKKVPTSTPAPQPTQIRTSPTVTPTLPPYCSCNGSNCVGSTCVFVQKGCVNYNGFSCNTSPNFAVMEAYCNNNRCGTQYICGYSANCSGAQNCNPNSSNCEARNLPLDCNYNRYVA